MVLDARIVEVNSEANQYALSEIVGDGEYNDPHSYKLSFDFMDNLDFVVTQIVHTGDAAKKNCYERRNQGVKKMQNVSVPMGASKESWESMLLKQIENPLVIRWVGSVFYLCIGLFGIWSVYHPDHSKWYWFFATFGIVASLIMFFGSKRKPPVNIYQLISSNKGS
jgi:hypothetical protein